MRFEFPFNLTAKSTMTFLTGQSWRYSNPDTQVEAENKDFGASSQTDLTRSLVSSVKQANWIDLKLITYTFA